MYILVLYNSHGECEASTFVNYSEAVSEYNFALSMPVFGHTNGRIYKVGAPLKEFGELPEYITSKMAVVR